ncbi:hypothetical protein EMIT0P2_10216 [Pseudomonas sp. IT-P2]
MDDGGGDHVECSFTLIVGKSLKACVWSTSRVECSSYVHSMQ